MTDKKVKTYTPKDIAKLVDVTPKRLRVYLRKEYGGKANSEGRWIFEGKDATDVIDAAKAYFA